MPIYQPDNAVGVDVSQVRLQKSHDPFSTDRNFSKVLDGISTGLSIAGPPAYSALGQGGSRMGAAAVAATLSGFGQSGSAATTPYAGWASPGMTPGMNPAMGKAMSLGDIGRAPGAPSSYGAGGVAGTGSTPYGSAGQFDQQLNSMNQSNMVLLAVQQKMHNSAQSFTIVSNIHKAGFDVMRSIIQNVRAG